VSGLPTTTITMSTPDAIRSPRAIRIVLVDDQPLARRALSLLLRDEPEVDVVGEAVAEDAVERQ